MSAFKLDTEESNVTVGTFGGQDKPDNVTALNLKVTEQELVNVKLHLACKYLHRANKIMKDLLESIWMDLNTGSEGITLKNYKRIEELCR
ncbi:MAG: hypothetical protein RIE52_12115 [Balneola sp.]